MHSFSKYFSKIKENKDPFMSMADDDLGTDPEDLTSIPDPEPEPTHIPITGDIIVPSDLINKALFDKQSKAVVRDLSEVERYYDEVIVSTSTELFDKDSEQGDSLPIPPDSDQSKTVERFPKKPSSSQQGQDQGEGQSDQESSEDGKGQQSQGQGQGEPQEGGEDNQSGSEGQSDQESGEDGKGQQGQGEGEPQQGQGSGEGKSGGASQQEDQQSQKAGSGAGEQQNANDQSKTTPGDGQGRTGQGQGKERTKDDIVLPGEERTPKQGTQEASDANVDQIRRNIERAQKDFYKNVTQQQRDEIIKRAEKVAKDIEVNPEANADWWKQKTKNAANIDSSQERGEGPSSLVDRIIERLQTKLNWKQILRNFFTRPSKVRYNITRPNKRGIPTKTYIQRREKDSAVDKFVIAIDTSGSVMDAYSYFISEIIKLFETIPNTQAIVVFWTSEIVGSLELKKSNYKKILNAQPASGGTTISSLGYWLASLKWNPAGVVVLTDGHVESQNQIFLPTKTKLGKKIIYKFFITPRGNLEILEPWGPVYEII